MKQSMQAEFNKFIVEMQKRMDLGQEKYGDNYNSKNIKKELLDEAVDLSNYAFLLHLKAQQFNEKIS